jgi:hypothetical protein
VLQVKGWVDWIFVWVGVCDAMIAAAVGLPDVVALGGEE